MNEGMTAVSAPTAKPVRTRPASGRDVSFSQSLRRGSHLTKNIPAQPRRSITKATQATGTEWHSHIIESRLSAAVMITAPTRKMTEATCKVGFLPNVSIRGQAKRAPKNAAARYAEVMLAEVADC